MALRALREDANLRIERAARELECSTAKVSRLENGLGPAKNWEVRTLLTLYGVIDEATYAQFDAWATATKSTGWWESDADLTDDDEDRYIATETESALLRMFCTPGLPVILQTPEYALAHIRAWAPERSRADAERFIGLTMQRQEELLRPGSPLRLEAVVDEAAVRRQVGSPEIHAAQLAWLADLLDSLAAQDRSDVVLQVLPFTAGSPGRAMSAFTIFSPREPLDPVSAFVEETWGGAWYEGAETEPLVAIYAELAERSLDPRASRALLRAP
jgi:Domain of unknown function (DUF5753)/Helix-turn-helix domain